MGKTIRKYPVFRSGAAKRIRMRGEEPRVERDLWTSRSNVLFKVAERCIEKGMTPQEIAHKLVSKAKGARQAITYRQALETVEAALDRTSRKVSHDWEAIRRGWEERARKDALSKEIVEQARAKISLRPLDYGRIRAWLRRKLGEIWEDPWDVKRYL